jgi:ribosome-binding factor A
MPREFSRTLRLNVQLQRELSMLIRAELTDPRVMGVSITHVSVAPDMRNARVSVSLIGEDAKLKAAAKALNGAATLLRRALGRTLKLRYVPALSFVADEALREGDRIGSLIRDATARDRARPVETGELKVAGGTAAGGAANAEPEDGET